MKKNPTIEDIVARCQDVAGQSPAKDCPLFDDDFDGRFVLIERGHYNKAWVSSHDSPDEAARYVDGQEYGDDWDAVELIDRETGETFSRVTTWKVDAA